MAKGRPMTLEQHQALGAELEALNRRLVTLQVDIGNRYTKQLGARVGALTSALSRLRSDMDALVFKENPDQPREILLAAYYCAQRDQKTGKHKDE